MGKNEALLHSHKSEEDSNNDKLTSSQFHHIQPAPHQNGKLPTLLCPFTPNPVRENADPLLSPTTSPLSSDSPSPPLDLVVPSKPIDCMLPPAPNLVDSPRTPRDGVFDPFAPGPDNLLLAPLSKKLLTDSNKLVARRLNFNDDDDDGVAEARDDTEDALTLSEKVFLDTVYGTLLEAIVKKQTEDFVAQNHPVTSQEPHTPTSPPRLSGIAGTCLGAPVKAASRKPRNIDPGLCRKLEF